MMTGVCVITAGQFAPSELSWAWETVDIAQLMKLALAGRLKGALSFV